MLAGRFARAGCPTDVSHDTVRVIGAEVIAAAGSDGPRAGPGDALAATAGTSDSPWRDQRANGSGLRQLTQLRWDRTVVAGTGSWLCRGWNRVQSAPGVAPGACSISSNYFFELEPRYGIEP